MSLDFGPASSPLCRKSRRWSACFGSTWPCTGVDVADDPAAACGTIDELSVFGDLNADIHLGVGLVDIKDNEVESPELIAKRIEQSEMQAPDETTIALTDFYAILPQHRYLYVPTGDLWPAESGSGKWMKQRFGFFWMI